MNSKRGILWRLDSLASVDSGRFASQSIQANFDCFIPLFVSVAASPVKFVHIIHLQSVTYKTKFKFLALLCHNSSQWQQVVYQIGLV